MISVGISYNLFKKMCLANYKCEGTVKIKCINLMELLPVLKYLQARVNSFNMTIFNDCCFIICSRSN